MARFSGGIDIKQLSRRTATRARLGFALVVLAVVPLVALAILSIDQQRDVAIENAYVNLEGIATSQVGQLESLIAADRELAELLASTEQVQAAFESSAADNAAVEDMLLDALASSDRLLNICLHTVDGDAVASVDPDGMARYAAADLAPGESDYTSRILEGADGRPTSLTTAPVTIGGMRVGTVTIETDATLITDLAADFAMLNDTGETSVAQPTPDGAQFIAPLRFRTDAVLNVTIPTSRTDAPITLAINGIEGRFGETVDYRDEPVLAVTRQIEATGWGVVVKIDRAEALAGVDRFEQLVTYALLSAIALIVAVSFSISRRIWNPVTEITETAVAVANGDRTRRAEVRRADELGVLAHAMNTMTDELVESVDAAASRRSELEAVNARLSAREEELRSIFEHAVDGIVNADEDGRIRSINVAAQELFGLSSDDARGIPVFTLLTAENHTPTRLFAEVAAAGPEGVEMTALNRSGQQVPVHVAVNRFDVGSKVSYTALVRDISERRAFEDRLSHQATHDALTGLPNRAHFREMLDMALEASADNDSYVGVLFIDLDRFKVVNDSRGHAAGDQLLRLVAERLQNALRAGDLVARFGGDEFVILCPSVRDAGQAEALARRIHSSFDYAFMLDGDEPEHIACSIGVALSTGATSPDSLISDADVAMYRAKSDGRNLTVLFDADMRSWVQARHEMEVALRQAIACEEIEVHYQPIVNITTGAFHSLEALARWDRLNHGRVNPGEFIAVAEESGLIIDLGRLMFRKVCEQQVRWSANHHNDMRVSVNLSAKELTQPDCFDAVARIIADTGADPSLLALEFPETALGADQEVALGNLAQLGKLGLSVAVDDFGTGYSSLTHLRQFPIDIVKIDRSFMAELDSASPESSVVSLVVGLGESLGIDVIAEGIETEAELVALQALGCGYAQGYLFARPQPESEITKLLWPEFDTSLTR